MGEIKIKTVLKTGHVSVYKLLKLRAIDCRRRSHHLIAVREHHQFIVPVPGNQDFILGTV